MIKLLGILANFSCRHLLCGWHVQKHFISRFSSLSKTNLDLFRQISNLPFIKDASKFEEIIKDLFDSDNLSDSQLEYLKSKLERKKQWARCYTKEGFAGGICTTSRVEGLHSIQKKYLTSSSSLKTVFDSFRKLEKIQIHKFVQEYGNRCMQNIDDISSLKIF